jgi:hypothetical protein
MNNISKSRRAFFLQGGAMLGAGVATAASATSVASVTIGESRTDVEQSTLQQQLADAQDREAIRQLHVAFISQVENNSHELAGKHVIQKLRYSPLQQEDVLVFSADRLEANAIWHVDAALGMPLEGNSTVAQMARLQGQLANRRWESGRLGVRYEKSSGQWKMTAVSYQALETPG